jgi:membrane protein involved in colicin uptake
MNPLNRFFSLLLIFQLALGPALAQGFDNSPFASPGGGPANNYVSGISNLKIVDQAPDGTEVTLNFDYTYDGIAGPTAKIIAIIEKKGEKGIGGWFGCDPAVVSKGSGPVSLRIRYFNDEFGVPPQFTSDRGRILFLNNSGISVVSSTPFIKTIKWGSANAHPADKPSPAAALVTSGNSTSASKLAEEKRQAEAKALAELKAREDARLKAQSEAAMRKQLEERALAEAKAREEARLKAEAEAKRLAAEKAIAEAKAKKEAEQREQARLKAEAEAQAREQARLKAESETKRLAEEKRLADEKAAQEKAEAEKARLAAEAKIREEARARAEAESKRLAEQRRVAEAKAKKEADEREQARLKAEAEAQAREEAHLKAETEAKRLAEENRLAEEKAIAETKARKEAEAKAHQDALAQSNAEAAAKKAAQEIAIADAASTSAAPIGSSTGPSLEIAQGVKSKVTNVDVVNRSIDRTQMTIGVEYDYSKDDAGPKASMGVDVLRQTDPGAANFFKVPKVEVGKSRRNFVLFPVKFTPPPGIGTDASGFSTDKVLVYLTNDSSKRLNLFAATMLLMWRAPGSVAATQIATATHTIDFDDFKQNDASDGYVAIRYNLLGGAGKLRVAVYDSANPATREYFATSQVDVTPGRGLQTLEVKVEPESKSPTDFIRADTIEIEMIDPAGKTLAKTSKKTTMTWSKPKQ